MAACKAASHLMGDRLERPDAALVPEHCCRLWEKDPQFSKHKRPPPQTALSTGNAFRKKHLVQHQTIKVLLQLLTHDFETKNLVLA